MPGRGHWPGVAGYDMLEGVHELGDGFMNLVMRRGAPWALLALLMGASAIAPQAAPVRPGLNRVMPCESQRGERNFCPANTEGGVRLRHSYGEVPCVRGRTWDFDRRGVWVSDGCRGDFEVRRGEPLAPPREESLPWQGHDDRRSERRKKRRAKGRDGDLVVCESRGRKRHFCRVDTRGRVRLEMQLSHTDCVRGETWGLDDRGIWVDDGCRGEFRIERRRRHHDEYRHEHYRDDYREDRIIRCESRHREEVHCRVDARGEVRLIDQLSRRECRRGDTWGTDRHGIWVRKGCRAKFRVGHRRH